MKTMIIFCTTLALSVLATNIRAQVKSSMTYSALSSTVTATAQNHQPGKRYTQKEGRERMWAESHANAAGYRAKFGDNFKIASDKKESIQRRRSALVDMARSQDLRAARELLKFMDSAEAPIADSALGSLSQISYAFRINEDLDQLKELKRIAEPKILSIANEDPMDMHRAANAAAMLSEFGDDAEAVALAKKLFNKGRYDIINLFWYRDSSTTPETFKIKSAAKQLFLDSISEKQPEEVRVMAASLLAKAGDVDVAVPVLSDVLLHGNDMKQRYNAMFELYHIGDERSREAVRKATDIPALAPSAKDRLMSWDKRPTK